MIMQSEVEFVPVLNDDGFLAGVRKNDDSDHYHQWAFRNNGKGAVCTACKLHVRVYTVQEALQAIPTSKI